MQQCPCGTGKAYLNCCGIFISQQKIPPTPEALMRSRYTAYTQANIDYIVETMKSPAADNFNVEDARAWAKEIDWAGLNVLHTTHDAKKGIVEFQAFYFVDGKKNSLHEVSEFIFENDKWFYVNGVTPRKKLISKIGRNDLCACGSHKKYKKCCGRL
jgi:SEC-C motif-containing protein